MKKDDHAALAVVGTVVVEDDADNADAAACTLCGGPVRICGGMRHCVGGPLDPLERRWINAIRLVYAGLCLTSTPATLWGGALLRLASLLTRGTSVSRAFVSTAAAYTDPGGALPGVAAAEMAMTYLLHRDVDQLQTLFRSLPDADAAWLAEIRIVGPRAALATPLEHTRFALFAVPCVDCAALAPMEPLFVYVGTYDAAIRCPRCGVITAHPLPVRIGAPHPVGRCLGAGTSCRAHGGYALDASGLCLHGRATLARARLEAEKIGSVVTARDRALIDALARAQEVKPLPSVAAIDALSVCTPQAPSRGPGMESQDEDFMEAFAALGLRMLLGETRARSASRRKRRRRRNGAELRSETGSGRSVR